MHSPPLPFCPFSTPQDFGSTKSITSRCDFLQNLVANGCAGAIESPSSSISVLQDIPLSSKGSGQTHLDVTQITPQKVALNLRPGESSAALWGVGGGRKGGQDMPRAHYSSWPCNPLQQVTAGPPCTFELWECLTNRFGAGALLSVRGHCCWAESKSVKAHPQLLPIMVLTAACV